MTEDDHAISKEDNEKGSRNIFSQVKYYTVQALGLKFISQALMFYQKKKKIKKPSGSIALVLGRWRQECLGSWPANLSWICKLPAPVRDLPQDVRQGECNWVRHKVGTSVLHMPYTHWHTGIHEHEHICIHNKDGILDAGTNFQEWMAG